MMETTMYTDHVGSGNQLKKMKSSMTLDFNSTKTKQQKLNNLLLSPELGLLKLASPELERMIIQSNGLVTTTPTPTQFLFPKSVTEEQEAYARGFVDALAELHGSQAPSEDSSESTVTEDSLPRKSTPAPSTYTTLTTVTVPNVSARTQAQSIFTTSNSLPTSTLPAQVSMTPLTQGTMTRPGQHMTALGTVSRPQSSMVLPASTLGSPLSVKQEDSQIVPCLGNTPPMSPIDMESQERIKLERKRARNRVAARKCRTRKLERISRLEDKVADLKGHNHNLSQTANSLREEVVKLKQQIMEHVNSGCQVMLSPNLK